MKNSKSSTLHQPRPRVPSQISIACWINLLAYGRAISAAEFWPLASFR
jgi:hypothetical protein